MVKKSKGKSLPLITRRFQIEDNAQEIFEHFVRQEILLPQKEELQLKAEKKTKAKSREYLIDLHGLTGEQALFFLEKKIASLKEAAGDVLELKIITGRGLRSGRQGSLLAGLAHDFVLMNYSQDIVSIESSPMETVIDGVCFRGHFRVKLKK